MAVLIVRRCFWRPEVSAAARGWLFACVASAGACGAPEWPKAAVEAPGSKLYMEMRRVPQPYRMYLPQQSQKQQKVIKFCS